MQKFKILNENYWKNVTIIIFITFSSLTFGKLNQNNLIMPKLIQQPAGHDAELHCGIHEQHANFMNQSIVYWDFKKCTNNDGYFNNNRNPCRNYQQNQHYYYHHQHPQNFQHNQQHSQSSATTQIASTASSSINLNNAGNPIDKNETINQNLTSTNDEWVRILCDQTPCRALLLIKNATEQNSGLYRCSIQPYRPNDKTTLQIQVVKTYQLHVINTTIALPELLDNLPANQTASIGSQVVLQCHVHSKVSLIIKWFRRKQNNRFNENNEDNVDGGGGGGGSSITNINNNDDNNFNSKVIQFLENSYVHLESAGEKSLTEDTYLSKLILNGITELDAGFYVCVGINNRGYKYREAYLNVLSDGDGSDGGNGGDGGGDGVDDSFGEGIVPDDYDNNNNNNNNYTGNEFSFNADNNDDQESDDHNNATMVNKELLLLFLIPLGLAAIPLTMWFCYLFWRWRSHRTEATNFIKDDERPVQYQQQLQLQLLQQRQQQQHQQFLGRKYSIVCSNDVYL